MLVKERLRLQELIKPPHRKKSDNEYRRVFSEGPERYMLHNDPKYYCQKPLGYSWFPKEIAAVPVSWAATTGNLVWFKRHDEVRFVYPIFWLSSDTEIMQGGHFAAMEQPEALLEDIEDFLGQVWS